MIDRREQINKARQFKFAREYRQVSQSELSKNIKGLSQSNLSKFEKGLGYISDQILKDCMIYLDWPFEWLSVRSGINNMELSK